MATPVGEGDNLKHHGGTASVLPDGQGVADLGPANLVLTGAVTRPLSAAAGEATAATGLDPRPGAADGADTPGDTPTSTRALVVYQPPQVPALIARGESPATRSLPPFAPPALTREGAEAMRVSGWGAGVLAGPPADRKAPVPKAEPRGPRPTRPLAPESAPRTTEEIIAGSPLLTAVRRSVEAAQALLTAIAITVEDETSHMGGDNAPLMRLAKQLPQEWLAGKQTPNLDTTRNVVTYLLSRAPRDVANVLDDDVVLAIDAFANFDRDIFGYSPKVPKISQQSDTVSQYVSNANVLIRQMEGPLHRIGEAFRMLQGGKLAAEGSVEQDEYSHTIQALMLVFGLSKGQEALTAALFEGRVRLLAERGLGIENAHDAKAWQLDGLIKEMQRRVDTLNGKIGLDPDTEILLRAGQAALVPTQDTDRGATAQTPAYGIVRRGVEEVDVEAPAGSAQGGVTAQFGAGFTPGLAEVLAARGVLVEPQPAPLEIFPTAAPLATALATTLRDLSLQKRLKGVTRTQNLDLDIPVQIRGDVPLEPLLASLQNEVTLQRMEAYLQIHPLSRASSARVVISWGRFREPTIELIDETTPFRPTVFEVVTPRDQDLSRHDGLSIIINGRRIVSLQA